MKISEMTNAQATDALLRICGPFERISDDKELMQILDGIKASKGVSLRASVIKSIPKCVAFALRKHRVDLYEIVGALVMKPTSEVAKMNFKETIDVVSESLDDVFVSFFPQSANVMTNKGGQSSAVSRGTAGTDSTP